MTRMYVIDATMEPEVPGTRTREMHTTSSSASRRLTVLQREGHDVVLAVLDVGTSNQNSDPGSDGKRLGKKDVYAALFNRDLQVLGGLVELRRVDGASGARKKAVAEHKKKTA